MILKTYSKPKASEKPAATVISKDNSSPLGVENGYEVCVLCGRRT